MQGFETTHNTSGIWNPGCLNAEFTCSLSKGNNSIKISSTGENCSDIDRLIVALEEK